MNSPSIRTTAPGTMYVAVRSMPSRTPPATTMHAMTMKIVCHASERSGSRARSRNICCTPGASSPCSAPPAARNAYATLQPAMTL
jgi:hypothetical protein